MPVRSDTCGRALLVIPYPFIISTPVAGQLQQQDQLTHPSRPATPHLTLTRGRACAHAAGINFYVWAGRFLLANHSLRAQQSTHPVRRMVILYPARLFIGRGAEPGRGTAINCARRVRRGKLAESTDTRAILQRWRPPQIIVVLLCAATRAHSGDGYH